MFEAILAIFKHIGAGVRRQLGDRCDRSPASACPDFYVLIKVTVGTVQSPIAREAGSLSWGKSSPLGMTERSLVVFCNVGKQFET